MRTPLLDDILGEDIRLVQPHKDLGDLRVSVGQLTHQQAFLALQGVLYDAPPCSQLRPGSWA